MRPNPAKLEHAPAGAAGAASTGAPAGARRGSASAADGGSRQRGADRLVTRARTLLTSRPELLLLLVAAGLLYLWALSRNGWANDYYSAAVRSMAGSWHDFLYGSFDPSGVMTVDKPPLALWVQALSVRIFGFSSLPILVPQALMGMGSVALVYGLVRRRFGRVAGFAGGLALVVTPITVAISRHNNPDALLILCSVAALWFLVRGLEDGRTRWIVLSGVMVGLGFETKMGAALLVVPGIALAWLWASPRGRGLFDAARQLVLGGIATASVALAWPVLVWLTPAVDRPWVSGTSDNSIWSLITNYNGLGRLDGQAGGPGGVVGGAARSTLAGGTGGAGSALGGAARSALGGAARSALGGGFGAPGTTGGAGSAAAGVTAGGPGGGGPGGGGGVFGGDTGVFRLLGQSLGGQAGWLLGIALVGAVALLVMTRLRRRDPRSAWLIAVGGAFATSAIAFSLAKGIFHPYYVSALAPFAAALIGATVGLVRGGGVAARVIGAAAVVGGVATTLAVLHSSDDMGWLAPIVIVAAIATLVVVALPEASHRLRNATLAAMLALLLFAPASWAVETLGHPTSSTFPAGGPADASGGMGGPGGGRFGGRSGGGFGAPPTLGAGTGGFAGPGGGQLGAPPSTSGAAGGGFAPGGSTSGDATGGSSAGGTTGGSSAGAGMGGPFGGGTQSLSEALAYVKQHGGGTVAVTSQQGAAASIISSDADVAGIGGFSGRESEVSVSWLAQMVQNGKIRWVVADQSGDGMPNDGRVGASAVMTAVQKVGTETSVSGLYDLQGKAAALRALAS